MILTLNDQFLAMKRLSTKDLIKLKEFLEIEIDNRKQYIFGINHLRFLDPPNLDYNKSLQNYLEKFLDTDNAKLEYQEKGIVPIPDSLKDESIRDLIDFLINSRIAFVAIREKE